MSIEPSIPLTPSECDLQDFPYMPLDVRRLRDSDLAATETPEACWCAVLLWSASWHQVPAASLPDDDRVLANLAGFGRVVEAWKAVREGALRGWVKCTDGRLYHPVVAEKAVEAWDSKLRHSHGKLAERLRKANKQRTEAGLASAIIPTFEAWKASGKPMDEELLSACVPLETKTSSDGIPKDTEPHSEIDPPESEHTSAGIPPENALKGEGEGEGEGKGYKSVYPLPLVGGTGGDSLPALEPVAANAPPTATPPPEKTPVEDTAKGTRLEKGWVLPMSWGEWVRQEYPAWTQDRIRAVAEQFRDYWHAKPGKDGRKADWQATWRNWVRREAQNTYARASHSIGINKQEALEARNLEVAKRWLPPELRNRKQGNEGDVIDVS